MRGRTDNTKNESTDILMKTSSVSLFLRSMGILVFAVSSAITFAASTATYSHDPKEVFISPGLAFFTTLRVTATDKTVGAFSMMLNYDTNALQIQQIVPASGSAFANNLFPDTSSFQSGFTRIVGFQTSSAKPPAQGDVVCQIVWRTIGSSNRLTQISTTVEKHVGSTWKPEEVWSAPATVTVDSTDSDSDGLPDWWEMLFFGSVTVADPDGDPDHDGFTNLQEFRAGTSPIDAAQVLRILTMELVGPDVRIGFPSLLAKSYQVEWCEDLGQNTWTLVGNPVSGNGNLLTQADSGGASHPLRFYRVRIVP